MCDESFYHKRALHKHKVIAHLERDSDTGNQDILSEGNSFFDSDFFIMIMKRAFFNGELY